MTQAESLWQMRCIARQPDYRPQVACGSTALLCCCCLCWKPTRRNESDEFGNSEQSVSRFSAFGWRSGFSLSSAKLLVKVSIDIFVCFPLASSAGRSVHTPGSLKTPAATLRRKVVYQLAGWAGKWNAVPLTLNNQALDPFSKDLSLSGGLSTSSSLASRAHVPAHVKHWGWLEQYQP